MRTKAWLAGAMVLLCGCSTLSSSTPTPSPSPAAEPGGPAAHEAGPLVFADHLVAAGREELGRIGEGLRRRLERNPGPQVRLRYALWLATPGHRGTDVAAARRQLERLLIEREQLDRSTRALVRWQLRHLREVMALRSNNARLTQTNERLRAKIRELTQLEQRMGSGGP